MAGPNDDTTVVTTEVTTTTVDTASSDEGVDWGEMASHDDDSSTTVSEPVVSNTEATTPPVVQPAPVTATPPPVTAEQPPQVPPVTETPPSVTQQQQVPPATTETPPDFAALRTKRMEELSTSYGLSEDEALGVMTDPNTVLPKMAANMHLRIMDEVYSNLPNIVGQMVQQMQTYGAKENEAKEAFYTAWPELRGHDAEVLRAGAFFRAANPTADAKMSTEKIGQLVMVSLGLTRAAPPNTQQQPPNQQQQRQAFVPATSSGGGAIVPEPTIWEEMSLPET